MTFDDIPDGATVFADANIFIFHFTKHPGLGARSTELMNRLDCGDLTGITSAHIVGEVAHRLMTLEAIDTFAWPPAGIAARLRKNPDHVKKLTQFQHAVAELMQGPCTIENVTPELVADAADVSIQTGLLSNDALIVAIMQKLGVAELASHDADFDSVAGMTRFSPA